MANLTRKEQFISAVSEGGNAPTPLTREERMLAGKEDNPLTRNEEMVKKLSSGCGRSLTTVSSQQTTIATGDESITVKFERSIPEDCILISRIASSYSTGSNGFATGNILPSFNSVQKTFNRLDASSSSTVGDLGCKPLVWNSDRTEVTIELVTAGSSAPFKFNSTYIALYQFIAIFAE